MYMASSSPSEPDSPKPWRRRLNHPSSARRSPSISSGFGRHGGTSNATSRSARSSTNWRSDGRADRMVRFLGVVGFNVIVQEFLKRQRELIVGALERGGMDTVNEDRTVRCFAGPGQRDADVCGF